MRKVRRHDTTLLNALLTPPHTFSHPLIPSHTHPYPLIPFHSLSYPLTLTITLHITRGYWVLKLTHSVLPVLRSVATQAHSPHFHPLPSIHDRKRAGANPLATRVENTNGSAGVDSNGNKRNVVGSGGGGNGGGNSNSSGVIRGGGNSASILHPPMLVSFASASVSVPDHLNSLARLRLWSSRQADTGYLNTVQTKASLGVAIDRLREWMGSGDVTIACLCNSNGGNGSGGNSHGDNVNGFNVNGDNSNGGNIHGGSGHWGSNDTTNAAIDAWPSPPPPPIASPSVPVFRNRTDSAASMASTGTLTPIPPCYDTRLVSIDVPLLS